MKNRNIQFKPRAGLLIPLLLACFAAVFVSAAAPAIAGDTVPFKGTLSGAIISSVPLDECHVLTEIVNGGNATQLGRYNGTAESIFNLCNLTYVGSYVFIAANGDSISGPFTGTLTPTSIAGVFDNDELAFITGGTGRFANATGTFNLGGQIDTNTGTFFAPWKGQSPPSARRTGKRLRARSTHRNQRSSSCDALEPTKRAALFFQLGERRRYHNDRGEIVGNAYTPEGGLHVVVLVPIAGE